jgi:hypothetical protein
MSQNQYQTRSPIAGFIAAVDVVLMFAMGILGNKISEILQIPTSLLLVLTAICLFVLATISYFSSKANTPKVSSERMSGFSLKQMTPKTMIGIFPFGAFIGMLVGLILPASFNEATDLVYCMPRWIDFIFGQWSLCLTAYEFLGVLLGILLCIVFAIAVDAYLAGAMGVGYGIALSTSVIFRQPSFNNVFLTYVGEVVFWLLVAGILIFISSPLKKLRNVLSTPRL